MSRYFNATTAEADALAAFGSSVKLMDDEDIFEYWNEGDSDDHLMKTLTAIAVQVLCDMRTASAIAAAPAITSENELDFYNKNKAAFKKQIYEQECYDGVFDFLVAEVCTHFKTTPGESEALKTFGAHIKALQEVDMFRFWTEEDLDGNLMKKLTAAAVQVLRDFRLR